MSNITGLIKQSESTHPPPASLQLRLSDNRLTSCLIERRFKGSIWLRFHLQVQLNHQRLPSFWRRVEIRQSVDPFQAWLYVLSSFEKTRRGRKEKGEGNKLPSIAHLHTLEGRHVSDPVFLSAAKTVFCFNYPVKGRTTTVFTFFAPADKKLSFNLK